MYNFYNCVIKALIFSLYFRTTVSSLYLIYFMDETAVK